MKTTVRWIGAILALGMTAVVYAQNPNAPGQTKKASPVDDAIAVERSAMADAVALAKGTDLSKMPNLLAVEAVLLDLSKSSLTSAEYRIEGAQRLIQVAEQLTRAGKPTNVVYLANRAQQHLDIADTPARDTETRAAIKTLSAWISERYLADDDAAQAKYEAAAQLNPGNVKAQEAATRIKEKKANVGRKPIRPN